MDKRMMAKQLSVHVCALVLGLFGWLLADQSLNESQYEVTISAFGTGSLLVAIVCLGVPWNLPLLQRKQEVQKLKMQSVTLLLVVASVSIIAVLLNLLVPSLAGFSVGMSFSSLLAVGYLRQQQARLNRSTLILGISSGTYLAIPLLALSLQAIVEIKIFSFGLVAITAIITLSVSLPGIWSETKPLASQGYGSAKDYARSLIPALSFIPYTFFLYLLQQGPRLGIVSDTSTSLRQSHLFLLVVSIGISALTALNTVLSPMFLSSSETSFRKSVSVIVLGLGLAICAESAVGIAFAKTTSTTGMVALNTPAIYTITFLFCVFQIVLLKAYSVDRLWIAPVSAFIGCGTYLANALIGSNVENSLVFGYSALCGSAFALAIVGKLLSMRIGKRI